MRRLKKRVKKMLLKGCIRKSYAEFASKGSQCCASDRGNSCANTSSNTTQILTDIGYKESDF